jgi:hypothetical protein
MNATITLSGIQLTASNLPLPDVATWFAWYYERNLDFSAEANTECSAVVTTSEVESIDATADANAVVDTLPQTASNLLLPDNSAWFDWYYERNLDFSATASVEITGVALVSFVGNVSTNVLDDEIVRLSGNPKRYSANQFKSGNVKLTGIQTKISTGNVKAIGVMSLSVRVALQNVGLSAQIPTILANGVLSISDEEFLLLMAA